MYSDRNLETEKNDRSRFSGKILTCYEVGPNGVILRFHKILLLFFAANNLNWKNLQSSVLYVSPISEKILLCKL